MTARSSATRTACRHLDPKGREQHSQSQGDNHKRQAVDFWARLDGVFDRKIDRVGAEMVTAMNALENRMATELNIEREERKHEASKVQGQLQAMHARITSNEKNDHLKAITDRLERLEMQGTAPTKIDNNTMNKENEPPKGWIPTHLTIGGWEHTKRTPSRRSARS